MLKGSITALMTPFTNGDIDWKKLEELIEWQIDQGTHGLVPCGTTGESPTLSHDDHKAIIRRCVQVVNRRIPVIAGTGSNATREAIELTSDAKEAGADACLSVTPYYNKPTQAGLIAHFSAIHNESSLPIVLYDIPGRSVVGMDVETIATLAKLPNIVGVKDATNDLSRVCQLREQVGNDFALLSGEDPTAAGFYALGGHGCISVISNVAPKMCADLYNSWESGDLKTFALLRDKLAPLGRDLFCESSPAPVKYAGSLLGLCSTDVRLPLLPASAQAQEKIKTAMTHAGLLS